MNLFRSEEHARKWPSYDPTTVEGTMTVRDWAALFQAENFRAKLDPDYFLRRTVLRETIAATMAARGKVGPFWGVPSM
ncbi:MAG: hypothetical protein HY216_03560 [Candidatus Rokubacteria bacterium]|nr:hypothetical protein [Candidatus Rokubacteria bacterium]